MPLAPRLHPTMRPRRHRHGAATLAVAGVATLMSAVPALAGTEPLDVGATAAAPARVTTPAMAATATPARPVDTRPNLVVVMADDLGWSDLRTGRTNGGFGSHVHDTPALDRLAEEGMTFDQAYAALNCAPTRTALLTGLAAPRPGNNVYVVGDLDRGGPDVPLSGPPQGRPDGRVAIPTGGTTVAETLRDAGYATGYVGKFHVTGDAGEITRHHGFEENFGGSQSGAASSYFATDGTFNASVDPTLDRFAGDYTQEYVDSELKPYATGVDPAALDALVGTDKHVSDALGDAALDFLGRHAAEPSLTFLSTFAVHSPVGDAQARPDLLGKYRARQAARPPGTAPLRPGYASLVEGLDQSVARIVDHLETTPDPRRPGHVLAENTVVVVTSDNGGRSDLGASNGPLRGQKGELTEGGVRVPWIVWSANPALVDGGTVNHSVINGTDLYPTLAGYARTSVPATVPLDGFDLRAAWADAEVGVDAARFWHLPGYLVNGGRDQRPASTVRHGRWKLAYAYETRTWELHDLATDLGETRNLAAKRPGVVLALGNRLVAWLDRLDAPLARLKPGRAPVRLTVRGTTYADGRVTTYRRPTEVVVRPGAEMPLVLPR